MDPWVLKDVNLDVVPGECVLLKGVSGAGKTTLIRLLCGNALPERGEVSIDTWPPTSALSSIAAVLQTDRLITGSIRDNVSFFRTVSSDEDLFNALKLVGLEAFVRALPMQLDTPVGEMLTGLSGGQKQRLLLARAALKSPKLLVLDEATSSLDVEGEALILAGLKKLGMTLIISSHRPEVWRYADKIYELHDGSLHLAN